MIFFFEAGTMISVYKLGSIYKIKVDEDVLYISYAEWLVIKNKMIEILASELFS